MIPDKCIECEHHMHIYDIYGNDTEIDEHHCENGRSIHSRNIKQDHVYSWCPHKNY